MALLLLSSSISPFPRRHRSSVRITPVRSNVDGERTAVFSPSLARRAISNRFSSTSGREAAIIPGSRATELGKRLRCRAAREEVSEVYKGVYGPWTIDPSDVREVILYRAGLVTAATSFVLAASGAFLPEGNAFGDVIRQNIDFLCVLGAGSLGLSLYLIHIYVTFLKRFLQILWVVGAIGSLATSLKLAHPLGESLVNYVVHNPVAIWFVGPLFASLTGLVFKEGLCYGKLEAGVLTFIIPTLLLGHLSGLMDDGVKQGLLGIWMALFLVFAARKFTQPIKDDIGDKSVFMFNALPEEEKQALIQKLENQSGGEREFSDTATGPSERHPGP